jgi:hypothetical protein
MQMFFGTLNITGLSSFLEPPDALLLMSGFPDPQQASAAATNFIVNVKGLSNGTAVAVTGTAVAIGEQAAIVMTDINAAGALATHAAELTAPTAKKRARKRGGR